MADVLQCSQDLKNVQNEHCELRAHLQLLDELLDALICYSEVYADLASAKGVSETGCWLAGWLPQHFLHEETGILASLALKGHDFAAFADEMRRQHGAIANRVQSFCTVAHQLENWDDIEESVCALKEAGRELSNFLAAHMVAEERKFAES